jgi:hypothetical protein
MLNSAVIQSVINRLMKKPKSDIKHKPKNVKKTVKKDNTLEGKIIKDNIFKGL